MTTHELKCWPKYFQAVWDGIKTFEVRKGYDRVYEVNDEVLLREYFLEEDAWGRSLKLKITYVMHGVRWLPIDVWVFAFKVLPLGGRTSEEA